MASQTSALPDGSTLTKPAYTDSADIAVINTNMDKIVSNINAENQALANKVNPIYNAPTETFNGDLDTLTTPGWYVLGTSATNAPPITASGRLLVAQMGTSPYIRQTYYCGYDNNIFTRVRSYYGNAWHWFEWQQLVQIKTKTVTGTADSNGFFDTGLKTANATLISVPTLRVNGELRYAFFASPLMNGGTPAEKMAIQFKNLDGNVIGKSATITATIIYIEF